MAVLKNWRREDESAYCYVIYLLDFRLLEVNLDLENLIFQIK